MQTGRRYYLPWLIILTLLASALRLYHLNEVPFTYDELSALSRTHYDSFSELINKGVAGDGHPAGVQVFLYYWARLVGYEEWLVKLPFIFAGICCVPLIYNIGRKWFGRDAGIVAAALMACLQYPVMYSQIARPYVSGLFLILLLVTIWNRLIVRVIPRNLFAYALVLALCAYNHYFSLMTAAVIAATGLFIVKPKDRLLYALSLSLAVLLFLPHLQLFLGQLRLKGLSWISVPTREFIPNYLYYLCNFSIYALIALSLLLLQGVYLMVKRQKHFEFKYRLIALVWFAVPLVTGYLYSKFRAPVLQYSVLIFSFPFLVLFIASFVKFPRSYLRELQVSGLLIVLVFSLSGERHYYTRFYHAETEMFAQHIAGYETAYGNKAEAVVNTNSVYLDFYKQKYGTGWNFLTFDSIGDNLAWRDWLSKSDKQYLILCNPPQEWNRQYLAIAKEYFPCVDSVYQGFTTDIFVLKKEEVGVCKPSVVPIFTYNLDSSYRGDKANLHVFEKGETAIYYSCDDANKYSSLFSYPTNILKIDEHVKLNLEVEVKVDSLNNDDFLSLEFKAGKNILQERKSLLRSFMPADGAWHKVYITARLYHSPINTADFILVQFNPASHNCFKFRNFKLEAVRDNPNLYSLIRK